MMRLNDNKSRAACAVGALLYTPASNKGVAAHVIDGDWPCLTALALCLEDTIGEAGLPEAEAQLVRTLRAMKCAPEGRLPMLFVRVRSAGHLRRVRALEGVETHG